jgi:hypothetical protein
MPKEEIQVKTTDSSHRLSAYPNLLKSTHWSSFKRDVVIAGGGSGFSVLRSPSETVETASNEVIMKMLQFVPESRILDLLKTASFTRVYKYYCGFLYGSLMGYEA